MKALDKNKLERIAKYNFKNKFMVNCKEDFFASEHIKAGSAIKRAEKLMAKYGNCQVIILGIDYQSGGYEILEKIKF